MGKKIFAGLVAVAFFYVASPLALPIAMGAIMAVLFFPWLNYLEKKNIPSILASGLLTLGISLLVMLPMSIVIFFAAKTAVQELDAWSQPSHLRGNFFESFLGMPRIQNVMIWITDRIPMNTSELANAFQELVNRMGERLAELLGGMLAHLPGMMVAMAIVLVSVYFFLLDGRKLILFFRRHSFFEPEQTNHLIDTLAEMCRSVILASVVSGGLQSILEILICLFTGTPNVALVGLLVFIGSFLPVVGSAPITFGVAIHQLVLGRQTAGIALLIMAFVIFAVDNTVRPLFLKGSANLHPLLAFVAAFGGLQTLGFLGVFLGPIIAALFVVTFKILAESGRNTDRASYS